MIMDSALFITSLFALVSALTTFFAADQAFGYGFVTLLLVGLVGGFAFYLMYYFCLPVLWTRHGSQSTPTFLEICTSLS